MSKIKTNILFTVILIFMIIIVFGIIYIILTTPKMGDRFTEFYILNDHGRAGDYNTELKINYPTSYLIGVVNHEYRPMNYTIEIILDGDSLISTDLELGHNQKWEDSLKFVPNKEGTDIKLEFLLFKENGTDPYRRVYLWVDSTI